MDYDFWDKIYQVVLAVCVAAVVITTVLYTMGVRFWE